VLHNVKWEERVISKGYIRLRGDTREYSRMAYRGIHWSTKRYVAVQAG